MKRTNAYVDESDDESTPKTKRVKLKQEASIEALCSAMEKRFQSLAVAPTTFVEPMAPILLLKPIPMRSASVARSVAQSQHNEQALCLLEGSRGGRCRSAAITSETERRGPQGPSSLRANGGTASPS